jgi:nucleoside 2-deoxyribosyltransferase
VQKRSFLISPVRGHGSGTWKAAVEKLTALGFEVYWPVRDTNQKDTVGYRICRDNLAAISSSDIVHVIWDGSSQGCLFDLGIAFALGKPIGIISIPDATETKSFQNMIREWELIGPPSSMNRHSST